MLECDRIDKENPQAFVDYVNEIHEHHRSVEVSRARQTDCAECSRAVTTSFFGAFLGMRR
jgi:hypothetical protein